MRVLWTLSVFICLTLQGYPLAAQAQLNAEEKAIVATLERETRCYHLADYACWSACWVQDEFTCGFVAHSGNLYERIGWAVMDKAAQQDMQGFRDSGQQRNPGDVEPLRTNFRFKFSGKRRAVVHYDQYAKQADGRCMHTKEIKFMEKTAGEWRIAMMSVVAVQEPVDCPG